MSDYYPLLSRAIAGLDADTGESRRALYARARAALCDQLRGHDPPIVDAEITQERLSLEAAIRKLEAEAIHRTRHRSIAATVVAAAGGGVDAALGTTRSGPVVTGGHRAPQQGGGERERLVELALLAQVIEAREGPIRKPPAVVEGNVAGAQAQEEVQAEPTPPPAIPGEIRIKPSDAWSPVHAAGRPGREARRSTPAWSDARTNDFMTTMLGVLYFVFGFAQLIAFFRGLQTWFGLDSVTSIGIFMLLYFTGSVGSIPMAIVAFYGAWRGWQWSMLGSALFAFPFVILSFGYLGLGGIYHLFHRQRTAPLVEMIRSLAQSPQWRKRTRRWRVAWSAGREVRIRAPRYRAGEPGAEKLHAVDQAPRG